FGYTGSTDPRGADIAREKFEVFLRAIRGEGMARAAQQPYMSGAAPGADLRIEPHPPALIRRIWWGAGSRGSAQRTGRRGPPPRDRPEHRPPRPEPHEPDPAHRGHRRLLRRPAGRADRALPRRLPRGGAHPRPARLRLPQRVPDRHRAGPPAVRPAPG